MFISHLKNTLNEIFYDQFFLLILSKYNIKLKDSGLFFHLLIFYLKNVIFFKCIHLKNITKFYSKEERATSVGNFYQFENFNYNIYLLNTFK